MHITSAMYCASRDKKILFPKCTPDLPIHPDIIQGKSSYLEKAMILDHY